MSQNPSPLETVPVRPPVFRGSGRLNFGPPAAMAPGTDIVRDAPSRALRCGLAREIASAVLDVSVAEIARANRSVNETCRARHLAIYLAHVVFQVPLGAIAESFGRDRTSVAHAIRRIEDGRDAPDFEALVARMERLASACLDLSGAREPA